jgi:hypothetical protein
MTRRPREISAKIVDEENQYPLTRRADEIDYPYFKQVLAVYCIEKDMEMP